MRALLVAASFILGLGAVSSGFGQAVAEGAMVHANSGAATAKVGSGLGNALSDAMRGNAEKMGSLKGAKIEHVPHASGKSSAIGSSVQSSGPLLITSIRGANKPCTAVLTAPQPKGKSATAPTAKSEATTQAQTPPPAPGSQDCVTSATPQSPSKSVVNLTFSK